MPELDIRYAETTGGLQIAYTIVGEGPVDVVVVPGIAAHLDLVADVPWYTPLLQHPPPYARMARRAHLSRTHDERDELERGEHNLITTWSAASACWWTAPRGMQSASPGPTSVGVPSIVQVRTPSSP